MLKAFLRDRKKCKTNLDPQSEVTCVGMPCLEKMWSRKSCVSSGDVMVLWVRMKMVCLDNQSTTTRMAVKPDEDGSCSMKSIEMEFQGQAGTGNCLSSPKGQCRSVLAQVQVVQDLT